MGFEIAPLAQELEPFVVATQGRKRLRRGLEGLRLQLLDDGGRQSEVLADRLGQTVDGCRDRIFVRRFLFQRGGTVPFGVLKLRVNANLVAQAVILSPDHCLGAAGIRQTLKGGGIEARIGCQLQVVQDLAEALGGNRLERRRLSHIRAQQLREFRPQPVQPRVAGSIAKRQDGERGGGRAGLRLGRRPEDLLSENDAEEEQQQGEAGRNPFGGEFLHGPKAGQALQQSSSRPALRLQVLHDVGSALVAQAGVDLQAADHHVAQVARNLGIELNRRARPFLRPLQQRGQHGIGPVRRLAGEQFVEDNPQREHVRARVRFLTLGLLRRHVVRSAKERARLRHPRQLHGARNPEIHHRRPPRAV